MGDGRWAVGEISQTDVPEFDATNISPNALWMNIEAWLLSGAPNHGFLRLIGFLVLDSMHFCSRTTYSIPSNCE